MINFSLACQDQCWDWKERERVCSCFKCKLRTEDSQSSGGADLEDEFIFSVISLELIICSICSSESKDEAVDQIKLQKISMLTIFKKVRGQVFSVPIYNQYVNYSL